MRGLLESLKDRGWLPKGINPKRRLGFSSALPDFWGEERDWKLNQSPMASNLIHRANLTRTP